jgi:hypothetical protein
MHWLSLFRLITLTTASLFSLIVLGLCAHILNEALSAPTFGSLGVATAVLTLVTLVPM